MNLSDYTEEKPHYKKRILWYVVNHTLFRCFVGQPFRKLRNSILRSFGMVVDKDACVYSSCTIYAPWNIEIGRACIGPGTFLYSKDRITIGDDCVVSQGTWLCTASHEINSLMLPLKTASIVIRNNAWVAAEAFIGPGVTVGEGAVVGARAAVFKDVEPWTVVGGNPARVLKKRIILN